MSAKLIVVIPSQVQKIYEQSFFILESVGFVTPDEKARAPGHPLTEMHCWVRKIPQK